MERVTIKDGRVFINDPKLNKKVLAKIKSTSKSMMIKKKEIEELLDNEVEVKILLTMHPKEK